MVESKEFMESSADVNLAKEKTPLSRHEVEESPFTVVGNNENGWVGTMGKYRITEQFNSKEEAIKDVEVITWNRIVQVLILVNQLKEVDNE
jgi:hypothetical protein